MTSLKAILAVMTAILPIVHGARSMNRASVTGDAGHDIKGGAATTATSKCNAETLQKTTDCILNSPDAAWLVDELAIDGALRAANWTHYLDVGITRRNLFGAAVEKLFENAGGFRFGVHMRLEMLAEDVSQVYNSKLANAAEIHGKFCAAVMDVLRCSSKATNRQCFADVKELFVT